MGGAYRREIGFVETDLFNRVVMSYNFLGRVSILKYYSRLQVSRKTSIKQVLWRIGTRGNHERFQAIRLL